MVIIATRIARPRAFPAHPHRAGTSLQQPSPQHLLHVGAEHPQARGNHGLGFERLEQGKVFDPFDRSNDTSSSKAVVVSIYCIPVPIATMLYNHLHSLGSNPLLQNDP